MVEIITIIQEIVERGLLFGIVVAAVYLSSKLINFDNLAVEGAFGLGGAVTATLLMRGYNPFLVLMIALIIGALSGIVTGILNTHVKLNNLISGIVVTTGLFSIILKIAGSNLTLSRATTIFNGISGCSAYMPLIILMSITLLLFLIIHWFLQTEVGFLVQAVGDAPQMLTNVGKSADLYIIMGLMLSNACAALSGALFVQYTGYFSIWSSVGILIIGLAGMIIAQSLSKKFGIALLIGSITYQALIALTFELQLDQDWNKLVTALLIVMLIVIKQWLNKKRI